MIEGVEPLVETSRDFLIIKTNTVISFISCTRFFYVNGGVGHSIVDNALDFESGGPGFDPQPRCP